MSTNSKLTQNSIFQRKRSYRARASSAFRPMVETLEQRQMLTGQPIEVDTFDDVMDDSDGVTSLREAVAEAARNPGEDAIRLEAGTYQLDLGEILINDDSGKLRIEATERAVLDAQGNSRVLEVIDSDLVIDSLTITGGAEEKGAGIRVTNSDLMINNGEFRDNVAAAFGGGIAIQNQSNVTVNNTQFHNNRARGGAGIATPFRGISSTAGSLTVNDSQFTNNQVVAMGGGIAIGEGVSAVLNRTIVNDNAAGWAGGGIVIGSSTFPNETSSLEINDSQIRGNSAGSGGGFMLGTGVNRLELNGSDVTDNMATNLKSPMGGGAGGGILMLPQGSNRVELNASEVSGNSAVGSGGGIEMGGQVTLKGATEISNNEFARRSNHDNARLNVEAGARISTSEAASSLSSIRHATMEGTLVAQVGDAVDLFEVGRTLSLSPESTLELHAQGSLDSEGEQLVQIVKANRIRGTFETVPSSGQHIGFGVFTAGLVGAGSTVQYEDQGISVNLLQASAGDANGDATFDQHDIVQILQGGKYLTGQNAGWTDGDFTNDGLVDQLDVVAAMQTGTYLASR